MARLVQDLIRIDSTNDGTGAGPGERDAAEFVADCLAEVGIDGEVYTTTGDRRAGYVTRIAGENPDRPALLVHGHLDVVPAPEPDWQVAPLSGHIDDDGVLWGRGAVDMKDMDGMILAVLRQWARTGVKPDRDLLVLFLPDEEAGGVHGSHWLVDNRPELFEGVTEAVGEVGGFSLTINDDLRLYPIQTAEKGISWLRLAATADASHGSLFLTDSAVSRLCAAASRISQHRFEPELDDTTRRFLDTLTQLTGVEFDLDNPEKMTAELGSLAKIVGAMVRNTANVTMLDAGFKVNVVPATASAAIDGRFLPGHEDELLAKIRELAGPGIDVSHIHRDVAVETTFDGPTVDLMAQALREQDPGAQVVPYLMTGGTDAKAFSELGIRCFGFSPLRLPPDLDFFGMFHNVNERVPVSALQFGVRVLDRFLRSA